VPEESEEPEEPPTQANDLTSSKDEDTIDEAVGNPLPKDDALSVKNKAELSY
jgi:hypothetical protein